ncbi:hypothetical protein K523DRAFT_253862 [Schizophyllum commune Tattone D]|nr:hypothetical protein K523DRAFT_253862 [Schizophyllum commune Tattone D]
MQVDGLACPDSAPEWIQANFEVFHRADLGDKYVDAFRSWLALEAKWEYDVGKGINSNGTADRPDALDKWIRSGRSQRCKKPATIPDVAAYEKQVWKWWSGMQPAWRKTNADGRPSVDREAEPDADWGLLAIHGQNGMLNAVALAFWWGIALGGRTSRSWDRFLDEIIWVCEEQV